MSDELGIARLADFGLEATNFQCFREAQGFNRIKPINIIIGRNNAGKSALLDVLSQGIGREVARTKLSHFQSQISAINITCKITDSIIARSKVERQPSDGINFSTVAQQYLRDVVFRYSASDDQVSPQFDETIFSCVPENLHQTTRETFRRLRSGLGNPFAKFAHSRIRSDRDIRPEGIGDNRDSIGTVRDNGENATKLLTRYLSDHHLPRSIVEETILTELNQIFRPDAEFRRIVPLRLENNAWEITLEESSKGLVPLSSMGSGVKTVLLVLIHLYLIPDVLMRNGNEAKSLSDFLFAFEELENNLHPTLQKRLFLYLRRFALEHKCAFFITTHSHVVVDMFSRDESAQVIHVTHDGHSAKVETIANYHGHRNIFDDLGVRASDILLTNVVVWVEGPSDKIYFNKWIALWTDGEIRDGFDYVVCFTAGSLIAHYSFDDPTIEAELIQAMKVNPNAIVLIDRDREQADAALKPRAERIKGETERMKGIAWITAGKEVENYIPDSVIETIVEKDEIPAVDRFASMFEVIKRYGGANYLERKVDLAAKASELLSKDAIKGHLDLAERLDEVCKQIRQWNHRHSGGRDVSTAH